jgi:hypothetical protein
MAALLYRHEIVAVPTPAVAGRFQPNGLFNVAGTT